MCTAYSWVPVVRRCRAELILKKKISKPIRKHYSDECVFKRTRKPHHHVNINLFPSPRQWRTRPSGSTRAQPHTYKAFL